MDASNTNKGNPKNVHLNSTELHLKVCRIVVQQCLKASLSFDTNEPPVAIGQGMVIFVCFLQGITPVRIENIVTSVLSAKLCEKEAGSKRASVIEYNQDVLIIPQATLGGKLKGKTPQYHGLVSKSDGENMFKKFCSVLSASLEEAKCFSTVAAGVYGARQILDMQTNGPFTHYLEF